MNSLIYNVFRQNIIVTLSFSTVNEVVSFVVSVICNLKSCRMLSIYHAILHFKDQSILLFLSKYPCSSIYFYIVESLTDFTSRKSVLVRYFAKQL